MGPLPDRCRRALTPRSTRAVIGAIGTALAVAGSTLAAPDPGDPPPSRPEAAGRVVRLFDFDERLTNPGDVPRAWFRAQDDPAAGRDRPGFPTWNQAELSYVAEGGEAFRGDGAVRLPIKGGSVSLLLGDGALPVFKNADYRLAAKARTVGLLHARACLIARFLDRGGQPIPGSERRSEAVSTGGAWTDVALELVGDDDAAYIQAELCVLQPEHLPEPADDGVPSRFRVWPQDFSGSGWFDDLAILQLPRIELTTTAPANIVATPERPELRLLVRDLTGDALVADLELLDVSGAVVDRRREELGAGLSAAAWRPTVEKLGWYRATMVLSDSSGARVGGAFVDFVWIPGDPIDHESPTSRRASPDRARFGLVADDLPDEAWSLLPEVVRRAGGGAVTLPAWTESLTPSMVPAHAKRLFPVLAALREDWQDLTLAFGRAPRDLGEAREDASDAWSIFAGERSAWEPFVADLLERLGGRTSRWQIGRVGDDDAFWRPAVGEEMARLQGAFNEAAPGAVVAVPTRLERDWRALAPQKTGAGAAVVAAVPPGAAPESVGEAARAWLAAAPSGTELPGLTLAFERFPTETYGMGAGATEAVKRAVEFWAACSDPGHRPDTLARDMGIALQRPWDWVGARRPQLMPRPELAAWRNLVDRLADRRVAGVFPAAPGVVCYILAPAPGAPAGRGGALVAWNRSAPPSDAWIGGCVGAGPLRLVDVYGNTQAVALENREGGVPSVRIAVSDAPVFIEGIDVSLALFIASFRLEPEFLESSGETLDREMVIENPWTTGITGRVTVLEPGGFVTGRKDRSWRITPRATPFAIPAGGVERLPLKVSFGPVEEAGPKDFIVEIELSADRPYGTLELHRTVEVGLTQIRLDLAYSVRSGVGGASDDIVVEASVVNTGRGTLTLEMTSFAPDLPRTKASVSGLAPGNQETKRFVYAGAAPTLRGKRVVLSVMDPESGARLTKSILIQ